MAFYREDGDKLNVQDFVERYFKGYLLGERKISGITYQQSSKYVEDEVMKIKDSHFESYIDVVRVMAWKTGRIRHRESQKQKKFIYTSDWEDCEKNNPKLYGRVFDLKKLAKYILDNRNYLEEVAVNDPQECLKLLRNTGIKGIGSVYLITLLFFLSHGKYPIYDRFAMAALIANEKNICANNNQVITVNELPGKGSKPFATLCEQEYGEFIKKLDALGVDYKNNRKVDQALWVYGHAFKVSMATKGSL